MAAALESLRKVNPSDVATLRALSQPPGLIKRIMDGVLLLLQKPVAKPKLGGGGGVGVGGAGAPASVLGQALDDMFLLPSWEVSTKLLSSMSAPGFLKMLADFDPNTVNDETVELLGPYIDMPDFEEKSARRVCGSMSGLCTWVRGMVTYQDLIKVRAMRCPLMYFTASFLFQQVVKPKDDAVRLQQQRMAAKKALLSRAQANLQESWDALSALTAKLEAAKQSKILLQSRLDDIRVSPCHLFLNDSVISLLIPFPGQNV